MLLTQGRDWWSPQSSADVSCSESGVRKEDGLDSGEDTDLIIFLLLPSFWLPLFIFYTCCRSQTYRLIHWLLPVSFFFIDVD